MAARSAAQTKLARKGERSLAEREGFEPPEPFPVQWFSRPPPSTTRPPLRTRIFTAQASAAVVDLTTDTKITTSSLVTGTTSGTAVFPLRLTGCSVLY